MKTKSDYSHKVHDDGITERQIRFYPPDDKRSFITVYQCVDVETMTYEQVSINWSAIGSVSIDKARHFGNALNEAVALARNWNESAGKKPKGIKGN
jgi:hypothetical protein